MNINKIIEELEDHIKLVENNKRIFPNLIAESSAKILNAFNNNKKLLIFGNGGSAADAQHIAAEFTGRFVKERIGLPAIALSTDTSALTAIGNDYGFDVVFSRQIEALAQEGDVLLGISTSGNSRNVLNALIKGKEIGCYCISLTGNTGGEIRNISDLNINVAHSVTARIQEMHIMLGHLICSSIDSKF